MTPEFHLQKALRIEKSLAKLSPDLFEIRIEAAMLASTHWLNRAFHHLGVNGNDSDVMHTYMLTVNEFRRLESVNSELITMMSEIEDLRPLYVRGDMPGAVEAADHAVTLLGRIRAISENISLMKANPQSL